MLLQYERSRCHTTQERNHQLRKHNRSKDICQRSRHRKQPFSFSILILFRKHFLKKNFILTKVIICMNIPFFKISYYAALHPVTIRPIFLWYKAHFRYLLFPTLKTIVALRGFKIYKFSFYRQAPGNKVQILTTQNINIWAIFPQNKFKVFISLFIWEITLGVISFIFRKYSQKFYLRAIQVFFSRY